MGADFDDLAAGNQGRYRVIDLVDEDDEEAERLDQRGVPKSQRQPRAKEIVAKLPEYLRRYSGCGGTSPLATNLSADHLDGLG